MDNGGFIMLTTGTRTDDCVAGPRSRKMYNRGMQIVSTHPPRVHKLVLSTHSECAKRWQQCLDPNIVSATWRPQDVETLLAAVKVHGHKWKTIADEYLPSRSTTDIKNRCVPLQTISRMKD